MKIETFVIGIGSVNCYLVINEKTKEVVIIDPGDAPEYLINHINKEGLEVKAILLTHGHFDHILGLPGFMAEFKVPVYAHEEEFKLLADDELNVSRRVNRSYEFNDAEAVEDGDVLELAGMKFIVIHTPGHTSGCVSYYIAKEQVLFSGDTLFLGSVGRSDFVTSNTEDLKKSIKEKLLILAEDTKVYPGHAGVTSIEYERKRNPYA